VELAGGDKAKIVLIPTAAGDDAARDPATVASYRKLFGSGCCAMVHTSQRAVADRADFVKPLADATGVWMMGGKPSALPDAYWHTATERALREVLERGGVVGGSSAGALIQGSRIPTSHPDNGFAFLRNTFIMPHLNRNNARNMLVGIVGETVGIIGIGISENTAAIVTRDHLEVVGNGEVVVVDGRLRAGKQYIVLQPGERFDLVPRAPQAP
jgi:cyanophycinase